MVDHLSVGVIGHVDHGKTTLVKALTGMDTDRLAEERERGLSIVLGFAYCQTATGQIDFIDAPGHADFVRTMISGATGIDAALIVVAADDGIMPQTREHIRIVSLLGIKQAVVALTKTDLVNKAALPGIRSSLEEFLAGHGMQNAAIIPVCAPKDEGIDALVNALDGLFKDRSEPPDTSRFYLPFDRVFTIQGFGTVATGTLRAGVLRAGTEAEVLGSRGIVRVRRLEVHGAEVATAEPGQRVAANIRVEGNTRVARGDAIASPGWLTPSEWWSASLTMAQDVDVTLRNGKPVRLLHGARELIATLRLLDRDAIGPGDHAQVQFRLSEPQAAWNREHFILRTISPVDTVGGGQFIDTNAKRIKRHDPEAVMQLRATGGTDAAEALLAAVEQSGVTGISVADLAQKLAISNDQVRAAVEGADLLVTKDEMVLAPPQADALGARVVETVRNYHAANPTRIGVPQLELEKKLAVDHDVAALVLARLENDGQLADHKGQIALFGFDPLAALNDKQRDLVDTLENWIRQTPLMPPTMDEAVVADKKYRASAELLIEIGRVVPLHDFKRKNLFLFHAEDIENAAAKLRRQWPSPLPFRMGEARELLGVTRKFLQPVLEYLDKQGITRRRGDVREFIA